MTQVISCQQLILRSFPKPLLPHKCNLVRSVGVAVRSNSRIVRWEEVCLTRGTFWPSCEATSRTHCADLPIARGHCFSVFAFNFAMCVSEQITPIFVLPVKMPAPCPVRLGGPTVKPCESVAVCRTRLSLPYVLRSTHHFRQNDKGTPDAKVALNRVNTGKRKLKAVAVNPLQQFRVLHRARQAFPWRTRLPSSFARSCPSKMKP